MSIKEFIVDNFRLVDGRIERLVGEAWVDTSGYADKSRLRVNGAMMSRAYVKEVLMENSPPTEEEKEVFNFKKAAALQRQMDANRVERAMVRKEARAFNSSKEMFNELIGLIEGNKHLSSVPKPVIDGGSGSLIIQLSDIHSGSTVSLPNNVVNMQILSKRLYSYIDAAIKMGLKAGVKRCIFALTGDLISSDRRPGEKATIEYNRAHATLNAFEIISGAINRVSCSIPVTNVVSICANEARVQEDLELTHKCFYDNFDWIIDRMLKAYYNGAIKFSDFTNPVERMIEVDGVNILLSHGLVKPRESPQKQVEYYRKKYPEMNHMMVGHIHSELCANSFSRSAGLPGSNEYSTYTLGIAESQPGQTFHLVQEGRVFSFPVDLTKTGEDFFPFTPPPSSEAIAIVKEVM